MINPFCGIDAALFDLDGTLIETHIDFPAMKRAVVRHAESIGLPACDWEHLDILTIVERGEQQISAADFDAARAYRREAFALLQAIEVDQCGHPMQIPGAAELLHRLRSRGIKVGIVTRNCRTVAERLLVSSGLGYDCLLTRDDVPRTKPDPAHLLAAMEEMGFGHPVSKDSTSSSLAVMIGDHWMDVKGGKSAGMRTVGILLGRPHSFYDLCRPDLLVDRLADLVPLAESACAAAGP